VAWMKVHYFAVDADGDVIELRLEGVAEPNPRGDVLAVGRFVNAEHGAGPDVEFECFQVLARARQEKIANRGCQLIAGALEVLDRLFLTGKGRRRSLLVQ